MTLQNRQTLGGNPSMTSASVSSSSRDWRRRKKFAFRAMASRESGSDRSGVSAVQWPGFQGNSVIQSIMRSMRKRSSRRLQSHHDDRRRHPQRSLQQRTSGIARQRTLRNGEAKSAMQLNSDDSVLTSCHPHHLQLEVSDEFSDVTYTMVQEAKLVC